MFEHPIVIHLVMKERHRDLQAWATRGKNTRSAPSGSRVGPRLLAAVGKGMVRLGLRLQGAGTLNG